MGGLMVSPLRTTPGNARNGQRHAHPTCWVTDTHEYALVTRVDWHPVIWRRTIGGGAWSSYDLSGTAIGLVNVADSHCAVAMGVDHLGRVWVVGNVHAQAHRVIVSAPGSITSWSTWTAPSWLTAHSLVSTYHSMDVFSDGQLVWSFDGNASGGLGRDWCLLRMDLTTGEWEPCVSDGRVMRVDDVGEPGGGGDALPDRSYLYGLHVDSADQVHVVGVWRTDENDMGTMTHSFYCRSSDRGTTWKAADGTPVPAPFLHDVTVPLAGVVVDGGPVGHAILGAVTTVGHVPVWSGWFTILGYFGCYWEDGWHMMSPPDNTSDVPTVLVRGDGGSWVWRDSTSGVLKASDWSVPAPTTWAALGNVSIGTPGGVYEYESGACYHPSPVHASGAERVFMVPDGDTPVLRPVGHRIDGSV